jgi:hypothetical protein
MDIDLLREKLIESMHSNADADQFFINNFNNQEMLLKLCLICAPYDKYSDDPRMKAAYYISQHSPELLVSVLPLLTALITIPSCDGEDMNGNIACHLIKAINKAKHLSKGTLYLDLDKLAADYGCKANG